MEQTMGSLKLPAVILIIAMLVSACNRSNAHVEGEELAVVTTTGLIADAVRNVGGEMVTVTALLAPGADPHLRVATETDITRVANADLLVYNGLDLSPSLEAMFARFEGRLRMVAVAEEVDKSLLIPTGEEDPPYDPHVWLDTKLWTDVVEQVYRALKSADPQHATAYDTNFVAYRSRLEELESYIRGRVEELDPERRILVSAHDAFGYFGKAYGFEVRGLQGISTATEATAAGIRDLADYVAEERVRSIFFEASVERRIVEALQAAVRSRGFDVAVGGELYSDTMGEPGTARGTYVGMMRHDVDTIVDSLKPVAPGEVSTDE